MSKADIEQQQNVEQDLLCFKMSFLTKCTEAVCLLGVAVAFLEPDSLAKCTKSEVCCCAADVGHSFPAVLCQESDVTESH